MSTKKRKPAKSIKRSAAKRDRAVTHHAAPAEPATVLVLRTCASDLTAHGGFKWPESGAVEAPDWDPRDCCGYGLHGLLWGEGNGALLDWTADAKWLVVEVAEADIVQITQDGGGKVKFPRGIVVHCGDRLSATKYVQERSVNRAVVGGAITAGEYGTATAGYRGTATAGYRGTATAGDYGTATAGYRGTATAGEYGTATAGEYGTATAGYRGTATAGYRGTATAGEYGTATAGDYGTATAGYRGTATAGEYGTVQLSLWDDRAGRKRIVTGYIGENDIKANVKYTLVDGKLSEVK